VKIKTNSCRRITVWTVVICR